MVKSLSLGEYMRKNIHNRIIINIRDEEIDLSTALECVSKVIQMGRISNENTQYCYMTTFVKVRGNTQVELAVSTDMTEQGTDVFHIFLYEYSQNNE